MEASLKEGRGNRAVVDFECCLARSFIPGVAYTSAAEYVGPTFARRRSGCNFAFAGAIQYLQEESPDRREKIGTAPLNNTNGFGDLGYYQRDKPGLRMSHELGEDRASRG